MILNGGTLHGYIMFLPEARGDEMKILEPGIRYLPIRHWAGKSQMFLKQYRILSLLLVSHQNFMVRPGC